ncbi:MAG TPA: zinc metallopeptidase [Chthoniobacteraceae bacterium]|nr:zinc metallopeptidase [Chthoniobacteraceae bacterium]
MFLMLLVFGLTALISLAASLHVKSMYKRYSQVGASSGATGAEVASAILQRAGIHDVEIFEHDEMLGDHYDPTNKRLVLSSQNYHGRSLAAIGVAAHECGHAIQHQIAYAPLSWRMASIGAVNFVNPILPFLPFLAFAHILSWHFVLLGMAIGTGGLMLFSLITLPVEFDASNRAKAILQGMGFIGTPEELHGVKSVLDAAGWTYVAAFLIALIQFLYYLLPLILGGRSRD